MRTATSITGYGLIKRPKTRSGKIFVLEYKTYDPFISHLDDLMSIYFPQFLHLLIYVIFIFIYERILK